MSDPEPVEPVDPVDPDPPLDGPVDEPPAEESPDDEVRRYPSTIGGAFYIVLLVVAVAAITITVVGDWRVGVRVLAAGLVAAAAMRVVLPQKDAGMLAVRGRLFDALLLAGVGAVLWWLAGSIPDQPGVSDVISGT